MGSSPLSLKRALLLTVLFALRVVAQNDNEGDSPAATTTEVQNDPEPTPTTQAIATPTARTTTTTDGDDPTTTEQTSTRTTSSSSSSRSTTAMPGLTTTTTSRGTNTGMPKLSRTIVDTEVPTYPPPTIPPTRNAPFMNHSTLPDGTVFIAVGAILGAFGVAILVWRAIVACLLHRSVERAALAQHAANNGRGPGDKNAASFPAPPAQFYKYIERESSPSLAGAGVGGSTGRKTHRGPTPSSTPSQTNLFFSPTAAGSSSALGGASNRDSARFLPSGFYASASPVAGGGGSGHHGHVAGNSISMSTLRPSSRGRGGGGGAGANPSFGGPSPPESPNMGPRAGGSRNFSTSSLNLNRPPSVGTRAPSAYLDDLLDEQPGMFPPAAGGPVSPQGHGSQRGRY
ncbi:hypothetical protein N657DRAFT_564650 [Parathielavia appendiculata]|uniref:Uncharacterized protein n=1 Tax=Parathielavia appendiculata TaxID=2587402 RepID=A0AAN6Z6W4_9PEZI|nr:hypothetical protein N657DRAFT_564650 [Parathielavia appendiculata]